MSTPSKYNPYEKGNPMSGFFGQKPSKIIKASKSVGGMFKGLMSASPHVAALSLLEPVLKGVQIAIKPFTVIMKILGGLFKVMGAEIMKPLFTALKPVMDVLMSLTPIFKMAGKIIGVLIQISLIPLTIIFKILDRILTPLLPLLEPFIEALDQLSPIIEIITDVLVDVLFAAIEWVFDAIMGLIKGFINFFIMIINGVIWLLNLVPGIDIAPLAYLQAGGIITSPTLAMMGEKESEVVIPLSKLDEFIKPSGGVDPELIYELQENRKVNQLILRYIKEGY